MCIYQSALPTGDLAYFLVFFLTLKRDFVFWRKSYEGMISSCQVGHSGVDRDSSSDARGSGFKPRPLHFKNTASLPRSPTGSPRIRAHPQISELSIRGGVKQTNKKIFSSSDLHSEEYICPCRQSKAMQMHVCVNSFEALRSATEKTSP